MPPRATDPGFDQPVDPALYTSGGGWTIDSTPLAPGPEPNVYLQDARLCRDDACLNSSANEALDCLVGYVESRSGGPFDLHIVGHGNLGKVITGSGTYGGDTKKFISADNIGDFSASLAKLRGQVKSLRLWACNAGEGKPGLDLLHALSQALDCPCYAPYGRIECLSPCYFALQTGTDWQWADPRASSPPGLKYPPKSFVNLTAGDWRLQVAPDEFIVLDQVISVVFDRGPATARSWSGVPASALLQRIDVANQYQLRGGLGAIVTARVSVVYHSRGDAIGLRSFAIYNDRVVKGFGAGTYYDCDDNLLAAALPE